MTNPDIPSSSNPPFEQPEIILDEQETADDQRVNPTVEQVSGRIATQRSIMSTETFWRVGIGDFTPDYSGDPW